jgi:hypothetical protein
MSSVVRGSTLEYLATKNCISDIIWTFLQMCIVSTFYIHLVLGQRWEIYAPINCL